MRGGGLPIKDGRIFPSWMGDPITPSVPSIDNQTTHNPWVVDGDYEDEWSGELRFDIFFPKVIYKKKIYI